MNTLLPKLYSDKKIIREIEEDIRHYDQVLLVIDGKGVADQLTNRLSEYMKGYRSQNDASGNVLVLSRAVWDGSRPYMKTRKISEEDERVLLSVYRMYDFSDHFSILADDMHYGNVLNYVKCGKLTWDEVFGAVLNA